MTDATVQESPAGDEPGQDECLRCYLVRMIRAHGCDNTKQWTLRWRHGRAPGDGQLLEQIEERGGICCDCEVVFNVWQQPDTPDGAGDWAGDGSPLPQDCSGMIAGEPLAACRRWHGWTLSDPYECDGDGDDGEGDQDGSGTLTDADALDQVAELLRDPEWAPGMLEDVRDKVEETGRSTRSYPDGRSTWLNRH